MRSPTSFPMLSSVAAAGLAAVALAACGSSSSDSKPAYCDDRTALQDSVKDLPGVAASSGLSALPAQLTTIKGDATTLVKSAKSDFPTESTAVQTSVDALSTAVEAITSSPSPAEIVAIATDAASVVSSVNSFVDATKSKCD